MRYLILCFLLAACASAEKRELPRLPMPALSEHDFNIKPLQGAPKKPGDEGVKLVVLDFWASWCEPCRQASPVVMELQKKYADRGVHFVGVSEDDGEKDARSFIASEKMNLPVLWDQNRKLAKKLGFNSVPTLVFVDPTGKVVAIESGFTDESAKELHEKFEKIVGDL